MDNKKILSNILWSFGNAFTGTQEDFNKELKKYNTDIIYDSKINTSEIASVFPQIIIQYYHWSKENNDIVECDFILESDNRKYFTVGELLYKIHNKVYEVLKDEDYKFFEGLELWEGEDPNIPLYLLKQGS